MFVKQKTYDDLNAKYNAVLALFGEEAKQENFNLIEAIQSRNTPEELAKVKALFGDAGKEASFDLVAAVTALSTEDPRVAQLTSQVTELTNTIAGMKGNTTTTGAPATTITETPKVEGTKEKTEDHELIEARDLAVELMGIGN